MTTLRRLRIIPHLDAKYLEAVLDALPEPSSVEIGMYGDVHRFYDESTKTVGEALGFPDRLSRPRYTSRTNAYAVQYILRNPSKDEVKEMVRAAAKRGEESRRSMEEYNRSRGQTQIKSPFAEGVYPYFHEAKWQLEGGKVNITLGANRVSIEYSGEEPPYVSELRGRLAGLHTKMEIGNF